MEKNNEIKVFVRKDGNAIGFSKNGKTLWKSTNYMKKVLKSAQERQTASQEELNENKMLDRMVELHKEAQVVS